MARQVKPMAPGIEGSNRSGASSEGALAAFEIALGARLPEDYRDFLRDCRFRSRPFTTP